MAVDCHIRTRYNHKSHNNCSYKCQNYIYQHIGCLPPFNPKILANLIWLLSHLKKNPLIVYRNKLENQPAKQLRLQKIRLEMNNKVLFNKKKALEVE